MSLTDRRSSDERAPEQTSDFGLRQLGGPLVVGLIGGFLSGAQGTGLIVGMIGLAVTGMLAGVIGQGMVGFIAVTLGAPIGAVAGLFMATAPEIWASDLSWILLSGMVFLGVLVPASGYPIGRLLAGVLARKRSARDRRA